MTKRVREVINDWVLDPLYERLEMLFMMFLVSLPLLVIGGMICLSIGKRGGFCPLK